MNNVNSLNIIEPLKVTIEESDESKKGQDIHSPMLPLSPLPIGRARPGQAALIDSESKSDSATSPILSASSSFSSLLRFIDSSVFSVYHAVYYLYKSSESAAWDYLGELFIEFVSSFFTNCIPGHFRIVFRLICELLTNH